MQAAVCLLVEGQFQLHGVQNLLHMVEIVE